MKRIAQITCWFLMSIFLTAQLHAQTFQNAKMSPCGGSPCYGIWTFYQFDNQNPNTVYLIIAMYIDDEPSFYSGGNSYYYSQGNIRINTDNLILDEIVEGSGNTNGSSSELVSYNYSFWKPYADAFGLFQLAKLKFTKTSKCFDFTTRSSEDPTPSTFVANLSNEIPGIVFDVNNGTNCLQQYQKQDFANAIDSKKLGSNEFKVYQIEDNSLEIEAHLSSEKLLNGFIYDLHGRLITDFQMNPKNGYISEKIHFNGVVRNNLIIIQLLNDEVNETIKYKLR